MRLRQSIADIRFRRLMDDDGEAPRTARAETATDKDGTVRRTITVDGDASSTTTSDRYSTSRGTAGA